MKKKILVVGAHGMAGHVVYNYLSSLNKYAMYSFCHKDKLNKDSVIVDAYDKNAFSNALLEIEPDIIVNCVGLLIKACQDSTEKAIYVNAYFPHLIEKIISEHLEKSKLIHISTDCVFSGKKGFYLDSDVKDSLDVYGMTKNLGEVVNNRDLTIRTSIIGPELKDNGQGLFHWLFSNKSKKEVNGYKKSYWGGVTTYELAKFIEFSIDSNLSGLFQLSNNKKISKFELLKLLVSEFSLPININPVDGIDVDKSIIMSDLNDTKYLVPSYSEMICELHKFMQENLSLYKNYLE